MSEMEIFSERIKEASVRCSIRLDYIIFPINVYDLFEALKEAGYEITTPPLPPKTPNASINVTFSGPFAMKDGNTFDGNTDRAFFGVVGKTFESSYKSLKDFIRIINENLGVNLSENISFQEIISSFSCSSEKNPIENISKVFDDCKMITKLNRILKDEVSLSTLTIVPKGFTPHQKNWFSITIQPDNMNPSRYNIRVIFRNEDISVFEEFGENMISYLANIIQEIES